MRGKGFHKSAGQHSSGITPAYAGKSETAAGHSTAGSGSPPRMRGKVLMLLGPTDTIWITPAYAGKSPEKKPFTPFRKDYPRVCWEKKEFPELSGLKLGSPPHMQGKVTELAHPAFCEGITPAHAGKSESKLRCRAARRDHPRICREKKCPKAWCIGQQESPPHMRGKV